MKVKMLTDAPGSPDGVTVNEYSKDQVYDVSQSLADAFVSGGFAEAVKPEPVAPVVPVTKQDAGPSENK